MVSGFQKAGADIGVDDMGDVTLWADYTPVVTAYSGIFTSVSATGRFKKIDKVGFYRIKVVIITNGTAATSVIATLPPGWVAANTIDQIGAGRGKQLSNKMLFSNVYANDTKVYIFNYDGSYPGNDSETLVVSGEIELA